MPNKRLNSYTGKLSPTQIAEGMNLARLNAIRLVEDAQILYERKRYPSAAALAILSIEESGKLPILRQLALCKSNEELRNVWKHYHSHTKKNVQWILPDMVKQGARKLDDFSPIFDHSAEHPHLLDNVKQISFYTDCLGQAHWSNPSEVITSDLVESLIFIAKALSNAHEVEVTVKEVELWIKHFINVDTSLNSQKKALLHWYYDMENNGLLPPDHNMADLFRWLGFDFNSMPTD